MAYSHSFNTERALEAILYVANKLERNDRHTLMKIMYFADKKHLGDYGALMFDDQYVKMSYGPVPSGSYDIVKLNVPADLRSEVSRAINSNSEGSTVEPLRPADLEKMSQAMLTCLDRAIDEFSSLSFTELTELSHDAAWDSAEMNRFIPVEEIIKTLPNGEEVLEYVCA